MRVGVLAYSYGHCTCRVLSSCCFVAAVEILTVIDLGLAREFEPVLSGGSSRWLALKA